MEVSTLLQTLPSSVTLRELEKLQRDILARESLLRQIILCFEEKHQCSLEEFERKLEDLELPEHPHWEESIEWRNAVEQLHRLQLSRSIFTWLNNLLELSGSS
jgi:transcription initiation factor TFIIIB Brf1 subunit/transcription initiation factor TFIIB